MNYSIEKMGVMNITPNSFSDGGKHLGPQAMANTLERFQKLKVKYLDIGAESTAPMNDPISFQEEWLRLQTFINVLSDFKWEGVVSLDSYRPKTAFAFFKELKRLGLKSEQFLWNDISGQFDEEVETFLNDFEGARYVFCHNRAPTRTEAPQHMEFVDENCSNDEFLNSLTSYFREAKEKGANFKNRVIFDPCFGFSKTYEQNLFLLENFCELARGFDNTSWVFGISKKSFLRRWWSEHIEDGNRPFLLEKSEFLHLKWLSKLHDQISTEQDPKSAQEVIFRVHEPSLVSLLGQFHK
jgi:dihydropteroate synthase